MDNDIDSTPLHARPESRSSKARSSLDLVQRDKEAGRRRSSTASTLPLYSTLAAVLVPIGVLYVLVYVAPATQFYARTGLGDGGGRFLFDSLPYYRTATTIDLQTYLALAWSSATVGGITTFGLSNAALFIQGSVASTVFPWQPSIAIYLSNVILLAVGIRYTLSLARIANLRVTPMGRLLLLANPFLLLGAVSLTKEAWGVALIPGLAAAAAEHRWIRFCVITLVAVFVREYYLYLAVAIAIMAHPRVRVWMLLFGVSFAFGFLESVVGLGDLTGFLTVKSIDLGQQMASLMAQMGQLQRIPFGHVIAMPVVLIVNVMSPMLNPRSYSWPLDAFYLQAATVSSFLCTLLVAVGAVRYLRSPTLRAALTPVARPLGAFVVLLTLYPISQHRYLLPAYPLLVLWAAARPSLTRTDVAAEALDGAGWRPVPTPAGGML